MKLHQALQQSCFAAAVVCRMAAQDSNIQMRVNELHSLIWANYIQPETHNLLTRLTMAGKPFYVSALRESPSIEDASLCGGMYLDSLVQRYEITRKPGAAAQARAVCHGLILNATVSPAKGMLARGTHPDRVTYWGNPSVDQYTGVIFGLWRYYRSSLATDMDKAEIRAVLVPMLNRMERDYWLLTNEDGDNTTVWDLAYLDPTRAERLLSFLLVGHDVSGDVHWLQVYQQKKKRRLDLCRNYASGGPGGQPYPAWVQLQNALALRILLDLAKDPADVAAYREGARTAADSALPQLGTYRKYVTTPGHMMNRSEMIAANLWGEGPLTSGIRNPFDEITTILLLGQEKHYQQAISAYRDMITGIDFSQLRTVWMTYPGEYNYWLAVSRNLLKYDPALDSETQSEAYRMLRQDVYGQGSGAISLR